MTTSTKNRFRGCLVGLAAGDALGTTLEFCPPGTFKPIDDMIGSGPFQLKAGQWTDDTSMALCLAESLIKSDGYDVKDQMKRYLDWMNNGHLSSIGWCFDIGRTTLNALKEFEQSGNPYAGSTANNSQANGSMMRLAPVPMYYLNQGIQAIAMSADSSRTTHAHPVCLDACRYLGALIVGALNGQEKDVLLNNHNLLIDEQYWIDNPLSFEIEAVAKGSFKKPLDTDEIAGIGYVAKSLEAALWAFFHSTSFEDGALLAVNLGDDADTTGAIYGQLAGAFYGIDNIPGSWRDKITMIELIEKYADKLLEMAL